MKKWFPYTNLASLSSESIKVFGLAHSGAGASIYRNWKNHFSQSIEFIPIQIPGRETRIKEESITSMETISSLIADAILECFEGPMALFGHSLGGGIAFEVAKKLVEQNRTVLRVFISACSFPSKKNRQSKIHKLDDEALKKVIIEYRGTPAHLMENKELANFFLPRVRADFTLFENHILKKVEPKKILLSLLGGNRDEIATRDKLIDWQQATLFPISLDIFDGDHFYHLKSGLQICERIEHYLKMGFFAQPQIR